MKRIQNTSKKIFVVSDRQAFEMIDLANNNKFKYVTRDEWRKQEGTYNKKKKVMVEMVVTESEETNKSEV